MKEKQLEEKQLDDEMTETGVLSDDLVKQWKKNPFEHDCEKHVTPSSERGLGYCKICDRKFWWCDRCEGWYRRIHSCFRQ